MGKHPHAHMDDLIGEDGDDADLVAAASFVESAMRHAKESGPAALLHATLVVATSDPLLALAALRVIEAYLMDHGSSPADFAAIKESFTRGAAGARAAAVAAGMRKGATRGPTN